jgi:SAM-dependent methyltransferase
MAKLLRSAFRAGRRKFRKQDDNEQEHWEKERAYWAERMAGWYREKYSLELDPIQNDPARVPPLELVARIQGTGKARPDAFLASGLRTVMYYLQELDDYGYDPCRFERILDFGVGLSRLIRHYYPFPAELYGCDVVAEVVEFSRNCCGERVKLSESHLSPPLPYDDAFFDYVYANSVFTHIQTDTLSQWIAELARIIRPGGCVIISLFSPNRYLGQIAERDFDRMLQNEGYLEWGSSDVRTNCLYATPDKLREWWGSHFEVLELKGHFKEQAHLVMKRP